MKNPREANRRNEIRDAHMSVAGKVVDCVSMPLAIGILTVGYTGQAIGQRIVGDIKSAHAKAKAFMGKKEAVVANPA